MTIEVVNQLASPAALSVDRGSHDVSSGIAESGKFISFAIGDDQYGVDIMAVREIKGWSQITRLPRQPDYMRGVLNLRGVMVPIIDLRCRFGQGMTEATPLHVVIVVQIGASHVGLLADRVLDWMGAVNPEGQTLAAMHYFSRSGFRRLCMASGLELVLDLKREERLTRRGAIGGRLADLWGVVHGAAFHTLVRRPNGAARLTP